MRQRTRLFFGLTVLLLSVVHRHVVFAASFDCARAASDRERLICHDPVLSDLDQELGRLYEQRRAVLSRHGAELLQRSESGWLNFIERVCPLSPPATNDRRQLPINCLQQQYRQRLKLLAKAGEKFGPFIFNRIDLYAADPAKDPNGTTPGFFVQHVAYPQIDSPMSPQAAAWNKENVKSLDPGDGGWDNDTDYEIGYANRRLISMQSTNETYGHGTAHPIAEVKAQNVLMLPVSRALAAQDIFGTDDRWTGKLQALFWNALAKNGWEPPENNLAGSKQDIEHIVIDAHRWLFTKDGLEVAFGSYEGGCYACTPSPVTVPWAALRPLFSAQSVVP